MSEALIITAVKATHLESKDSNGLSDPYAIIECGKEKFRTKIIYKTLDPEWNESFTATLHPGERIKVILWDDDRIGGDDFEGQCHIEWWKNKELSEKGETTLELPLSQGHSITKKGKVRGTVTIKLRSARFAEKIAKRGELLKLFPGMPNDEVIVEKVKCSFAKTTEDEIKTVQTHPGTVFLLSHYFCAHAQTSGEPYQFDFAYEMIKSVDKIKKKNHVVIAVSGGERYIFKDVAEPESFINTVNTLIERCTSGDMDHSKIKSINEEAVAQEQAPCTIVFKIYVPDHMELMCDFGILVTTNTNVSFKSLVEQVLHNLGVGESASEFRLYSCPPAFREKSYTYKKYDSTSSIASELKSGHINFGDVLILKKYAKGDKKSKTSKSSSGPAEISVYYCPDSVTTQGPLKLVLNPEDPLSKVIDEARSKYTFASDDVRIYRIGYSSDTNDYLSYVEFPASMTADQSYMTSGDTLYIKTDPPFKRFNDKFGDYDRLELTTYSLLCHCYNNPIHRVWKDESPLPRVAKELGLTVEESEMINKAAEEHAKYGVDAVLVELEDRMRNTRFNPFYLKETFANENLYKKWREEQRADILSLMETSITDDYPFCCELHVKIIRGTDLLAADLSGTSDPYCTAIYKTQRKSTSSIKMTLNPTWNETLVFNVTSFDSALTFFVYDMDFNDDDLLGTATVDLREHIYILDGEPHELQPIELDKKGSITIQLQCRFDASRYFKAVSEYSFDAPEENTQKFSYVDYYRLLYQVFGEENRVTYDRPWILKEFSSRAIQMCTRDLVRTTSTPNINEEKKFTEVYKALLQKIKDRYVIDCLNSEGARANLDTACKMLEPIVSTAKEVAESYAKDELKTDYIELMKTAIQAATEKLFGSFTTSLVWTERPQVMKYSEEYLEKVYPEKVIPLIKMVSKVFGADKAPILRAVIDSLEKVLSTEIDRYVEKLSTNNPADKDSTADMQSVQINVMRTIKSLTKLRADVKESTECGHDVRVDQGTGLIILWCRKSEVLLRKWVESVVVNDKRERASPNVYNSTSSIDINESITQTIGQLGSLTVEDPFVWTQAAELLVSTVIYYIQMQSHVAVRNFKDEPSDERRLDQICISLANMDKGQLILGDVTDEVDGFVERWKQGNSVSDDDTRTQITMDTINTAVGDAIVKSKAYMSKPLSLLAEKAASEIAVPVLVAARCSSGAPQTPYSEQITAKIDDVLVGINERVPQNVFRKTLEAFLTAILDKIVEIAGPAYEPESGPSGNPAGLNDPALCATFTTIFDDIVAYFSAGLSKTSIENIPLYKRVRQLLLAYTLTTDELITIVRYITAVPPIELEDKRFEGASPAVVDAILKIRAKNGDKWAVAYQKEGSGSEASNKVRNLLGLPPSELLIEKWACFRGNKSGTLYLMSKNLGFSVMINGSEVEPVIVPLKMITSVKKVSVMVFMKGIEVRSSNDDEAYVFSKFVTGSTESVIAAIKDQAILVGNTSFGDVAADEQNDDKKKK